MQAHPGLSAETHSHEAVRTLSDLTIHTSVWVCERRSLVAAAGQRGKPPV